MNFGLIAAIKQKPIEAATTTSCGWLNPPIPIKIIDFVTQALVGGALAMM
jgi:hypothetical protein